MRLPPARGSAFLLGLALAAACRTHVPTPGPEPEGAPGGAAAEVHGCEPALADPSSLSDVGGLAGAYRLVLVARTGPAAGRAAAGTLELLATDSAAAPFRGWTDVPAGGIGATVPGDAASRSADAPGVRVLVGSAVPGRESPTWVLARLGSHANREGPPLFDDAFAVLRVEAIESGGFRGTWASGVVGIEVEGHFCAGRSSADDSP